NFRTGFCNCLRTGRAGGGLRPGGTASRPLSAWRAGHGIVIRTRAFAGQPKCPPNRTRRSHTVPACNRTPDLPASRCGKLHPRCPYLQMTKRERSIPKAALAGLIGGLAGAGAKVIAEKIFPPRVHGQTPPPVILAEQMAGHRLKPGQQRAAMHGIHWAFGAL